MSKGHETRETHNAASLPDLEFRIFGIDKDLYDEFDQFMFLNRQKTLLNVYPVASLGAWTETGAFTFHLDVER